MRDHLKLEKSVRAEAREGRRRGIYVQMQKERGERGRAVLVSVDHCFDSCDHDRLVNPRCDRHVTPSQRCPSRAAACFCCRCLGHTCEPAKSESVHHCHDTLGHPGLRGHACSQHTRMRMMVTAGCRKWKKTGHLVRWIRCNVAEAARKIDGMRFMLGRRWSWVMTGDCCGSI